MNRHAVWERAFFIPDGRVRAGNYAKAEVNQWQKKL